MMTRAPGTSSALTAVLSGGSLMLGFPPPPPPRARGGFPAPGPPPPPSPSPPPPASAPWAFSSVSLPRSSLDQPRRAMYPPGLRRADRALANLPAGTYRRDSVDFDIPKDLAD